MATLLKEPEKEAQTPEEHAAATLGHRRALIMLAVTLAAILGIFHETLWSMVKVWNNSATYNHGFLIPAIALFLVWRRRETLVQMHPRPSFLGVGWLAGAALAWLLGSLAGASVVEQFALVGMVQGVVLAIYGPRVGRVLLVPLAYLLFMVPFGDFAIRPLQDLTAHYTTALARLSGVPIYLENWVIVIPSGTFLVAEACAGVRFLIAAVALSVLICDLMFRRWWKWLLFIALSIAVPIVANVFRAYGIVMIAHWSNFEYAVGVDHLVYGFIFLSVVMLILIAIAVAMRDPEADVAAQPVRRPRNGDGQERNWQQKAAALSVTAVLLALGVQLYAAHATAPVPARETVLKAPDAAGWALREPGEASPWRGEFPAADAQRVWHFSNGQGESVSLFVAHYREEYPGKELVAFHNTLAPEPYTLVRSGRGRADFGGLPAPAYHVLADGAETRTVWYWYRVAGTVTADPLEAKLLALRAKLFGMSRDAAVIAVTASAERGGEAAVRDFAGSAALADYIAQGRFVIDGERRRGPGG